MPEAVTRKVISAASRSFGSLMAWVRPPMIEANSASAAMERINALGRAANSAAKVAPKMPAMP